MARTEYVRELPAEALPVGGLVRWSVPDAERWRQAREPVVFAPVAGSWALLAAVVVVYALTSGFTVAPGASGGPDWPGYAATVLLVALPLWFRWLPVPTLVAAVVVGAAAAVSLGDAGRPGAMAGHGLALALAAWAFAGAALRLRARRRQRALALAASDRRRRELPDRTPESDGYRGFSLFYSGGALLLVAAAVLVPAVIGDLSTPDGAVPYDATGQQVFGGLLLVLGSTVYGRGHVAYRAARSLHQWTQPALIVGVRIGADGRHWVYPDVRTPTARPVVSYRPGQRDTKRHTRLLSSGSSRELADRFVDVDGHAEPFEAVLYGELFEGAEVALEYAVVERRPYQRTASSHMCVTAAPLLPARRHKLAPWRPLTPDQRADVRRRREDEEERAKEEQRKARIRQAERDKQRERDRKRRASGTGRGSQGPYGGSSRGRGDTSSGGCGGGGCGSSCGGGCGGGD